MRRYVTWIRLNTGSCVRTVQVLQPTHRDRKHSLTQIQEYESHKVRNRQEPTRTDRNQQELTLSSNRTNCKHAPGSNHTGSHFYVFSTFICFDLRLGPPAGTLSFDPQLGPLGWDPRLGPSAGTFLLHKLFKSAIHFV